MPFAAPLGTRDPHDLSLPLYGATFGQAIKRFFRSYARFTGRASRSEYWLAALLTGGVSVVLMVVLGGALTAGIWVSASKPTASSETIDAMAMLTFYLGWGVLVLWGLAMLIPTAAISWRRFHDQDLSGALTLLALIPYVGGFIVMAFMMLPSKASGQRYDLGATYPGAPLNSPAFAPQGTAQSQLFPTRYQLPPEYTQTQSVVQPQQERDSEHS